ncbi:hypothetical protein [Absidia glauca]|uniref:Uncharacterized protein n=1 Tax=Absidia glauca TaxID=4829 RepID=A0A163JE43_ABSGL|nr:hypothetical protein [Absidia glauca]
MVGTQLLKRPTKTKIDESNDKRTSHENDRQDNWNGKREKPFVGPKGRSRKNGRWFLNAASEESGGEFQVVAATVGNRKPPHPYIEKSAFVGDLGKIGTDLGDLGTI